MNVSNASRSPSTSLANGVGARIRRAREAAGLNQAQLSRALARAPATISNWESGSRMPGLADLIEIGEALDRAPSFFMPERLNQEAQSPEVVFRAEATQLAGVDLTSTVDDVLKRAVLTTPPARRFYPRSLEPSALAEELLSASQTSEPPVAVNMLANLCGAVVVDSVEFSTEALSGFVVNQEDGPVIAAHAGQSHGRQRFTVAHELGHLLLGHHADFHIDVAATVAEGDPPGYDWRHERAANTFAASLLMTAGMVRNDWLQGHQDLAWLAARYQVSQASMGIRLAVLGLR